MCIDEDEYVYTVSSPNVGTNFIKRLNYKASDVLNRNGYVPNDGDVVNETLTPGSRVPEGSSTFVDIDVNSDGTVKYHANNYYCNLQGWVHDKIPFITFLKKS